MRALRGYRSMHDLDIVIVTWNSGGEIGRCLRSIEESGITRSFRVTVVDNASADGTADHIQSAFPDVRLVRNNQNRGFAAANNQALALCEAQYWMLLNPDTELTAGAIDTLLLFMDGHPRVSASGPVLLSTDGSLQYPGRMFPSLMNLLWEALFLDRIFPGSPFLGAHRGIGRTPEDPARVEFVHGAALVIRRATAEQIGLLDEGFFMYFEEVDWCYRIGKSGGECWIVPASRVKHHGGVDLGHYDAIRLIHYHRSLLRFFAKHHGWGRQVLVRPLVGLRALLRVAAWALTFVFRPALREAARTSIRGYAGVLRLLLAGG